MPWFVLYTKSRNEKKVAEKLSRRGIEVYCPLIKVKQKWSDRIKTVETPLFKSYCFVNLPEAERGKVFETEGVVRYLFWLKKPAIVQAFEIENIKTMLENFDHSQIELSKFLPNDAIKIKSGAFADKEGTVNFRQGNILFLTLKTIGVVIKINLEQTEIDNHR